ncbi:sigma-w pathway protein ysdB [Alteribacter natronophilus]|uniref:sigma-w pathway protein ysdB n=1 Tax=Alteribacter natronophilus TaxID=2583810 RepID=UPI00110E6078|nr:sigma-w pathway protein ysdB [Alteribacter natronophilus]TMW71666.1 sigma-w pathway protein ysdB [Alteribacter natronophilus]
MFTVILFRILLLIAVSILVFSVIKYIIDPRRKLEVAHRRGGFHFLDDSENVRRNFLLTYRYVMFEGEKYLGTVDDSFDVTSVTVWTEETDKLKGLSKTDFLFIEKEISIRYPNAKIEWRSPIKELLKKMN